MYTYKYNVHQHDKTEYYKNKKKNDEILITGVFGNFIYILLLSSDHVTNGQTVNEFYHATGTLYIYNCMLSEIAQFR